MSLFSRHGPSIPAGWVPAPDDVKEEIHCVWQEDEMPDEVKNAPGYLPFTLSPGSEQWLAGMAEIRELQGSEGSVIIGRPRPSAPRAHRSLIPDPSPPLSPQTSPTVSSSVPQPPKPPQPAGPSISPKEWVRRQAPRNVPAISESESTVSPSVPAEAKRAKVRTLPQIGSEERSEAALPLEKRDRAASAPQIGGSDARQRPPATERSDRPRSVPQIGPVDD